MQTQEIMDLVLPYKDKLYRFALSIMKNTHDAEEIVQDLLVKIWKKKSLFMTIDNKEAWCMTVTRNLAFDRLRARKSPTIELETVYHVKDQSLSPEQTLVSKGEMAKIMDTIDMLPEDLKTVIQLREIEQYSYQEIADITGWKVNKVKVTLHRSRKILKEQLLKKIQR